MSVCVSECVCVRYLSVLQGNDSRVLRGADDVVVVVDAFDGALPESLDAVSLGSYNTHRTQTFSLPASQPPSPQMSCQAPGRQGPGRQGPGRQGPGRQGLWESGLELGLEGVLVTR